MRELLFKNCISADKKRTELLLTEHLERKRFTLDIEKKTIHAIKSVLAFTHPGDLHNFLKEFKEDHFAPQIFMIKKFNSDKREKKILCKIVGDQVVVLRNFIIILKTTQYVKKIISDNSKKATLLA